MDSRAPNRRGYGGGRGAARALFGPTRPDGWPRSGEVELDLLNDSFSRNSRQRKLALFEGQNLQNHFLKADVLDFQAAGAGEVARFGSTAFSTPS